MKRSPPCDEPSQLSNGEREAALAMMYELGVSATRRRLGVGAETFDRTVCFRLDDRPVFHHRRSTIARIRARLSEWLKEKAEQRDARRTKR
jgi:hypothetical protein